MAIIFFKRLTRRVFALQRKTDTNCPSDWLFMAGEELKAIRKLASSQIAFHMCRSKLAEVLEKNILKVTALMGAVKAGIVACGSVKGGKVNNKRK